MRAVRGLTASLMAWFAATLVVAPAALVMSSCLPGSIVDTLSQKGGGIIDTTQRQVGNPATPPVEPPSSNAVGPSKSAFVKSEGKTVGDRFTTPPGFTRVAWAPGSFAEYLRNIPLKPDGAEVRYYDGRVKSNEVYDAVADIDVGDRDLQQCADAVMRLRAEYLYKHERYTDIHFNFANGFRAEYAKWMAGYRITVTGNRAAWVKTAAPGNAYRDFRRYLDMVFAYANTASLAGEMKPVDVAEMSAGDVFIDEGHSIIVVDMVENRTTGKKLFMLAQSYMPAQDIQILKNTENRDLSPWYDLDFGGMLRTPEWTFTNRDLRRFQPPS